MINSDLCKIPVAFRRNAVKGIYRSQDLPTGRGICISINLVGYVWNR